MTPIPVRSDLYTFVLCLSVLKMCALPKHLYITYMLSIPPYLLEFANVQSSRKQHKLKYKHRFNKSIRTNTIHSGSAQHAFLEIQPTLYRHCHFDILPLLLWMFIRVFRALLQKTYENIPRH